MGRWIEPKRPARRVELHFGHRFSKLVLVGRVAVDEFQCLADRACPDIAIVRKQVGGRLELRLVFSGEFLGFRIVERVDESHGRDHPDRGLAERAGRLRVDHGEACERHFLLQSELGILLDEAHGVGAGHEVVGDRRVDRLDVGQIGTEIRGAERRPNFLEDLSTLGDVGGLERRHHIAAARVV